MNGLTASKNSQESDGFRNYENIINKITKKKYSRHTLAIYLRNITI